MHQLRPWKSFLAVNHAMSDCEDFDAFRPLQQSEPYACAARSCGANVRWLDLGCGTALVVERRGMRLISRGPVWATGVSGADMARALRRLARWPGVTLVTPESPVPGFGIVPLVTPMHHAVWSLGPDLAAGMAGKWRNRLVAAERAGVQVHPGGARTLDHLIAAEGLQRRQRRYRALPAGFTRGLPAGALRIWDWDPGSGIAAAMAFVVHGTSATYHLGWASDAARQAGVHGVMLMQAARSLRAEGVRWLDLGSVDSEAAPGLARFKLGTGAELRRLGPTCLVLP
jgi:Acetyltransferase (GNAT) domain